MTKSTSVTKLYSCLTPSCWAGEKTACPVGPRYLECLSLLAVSNRRDLTTAETLFSASGHPCGMGMSYSWAGAVIIQLGDLITWWCSWYVAEVTTIARSPQKTRKCLYMDVPGVVSAWGECVKPGRVGQRGMQVHWNLRCCLCLLNLTRFPSGQLLPHTRVENGFFYPKGSCTRSKQTGAGSAGDPYGFRKAELLLSASHSLCLFYLSHLYIVKPLRWDITSGVWKHSAQWASDFDQGFWGSVF